MRLNVLGWLSSLFLLLDPVVVAGQKARGIPGPDRIVIAVSLFASLHAWNDFLGPLIYLQDPNKYTLAIGLTFFQSQSQYDIQYNLLMAASVLVVLPVVIIFLMFQRAFVEGVTVGTFK